MILLSLQLDLCGGCRPAAVLLSKVYPLGMFARPLPLSGRPSPLWVYEFCCGYIRPLGFVFIFGRFFFNSFMFFFYFVFLLASSAPALRPVLVPFSAGPVGLHYPYIFRVLCSDELPAVHLLFVVGWTLVVASARQLQFAAVACWFFRLPLPEW